MLTRRELLRWMAAAPVAGVVAGAALSPRSHAYDDAVLRFSNAAFQRELRAYARYVKTHSKHAGPVGPAYYRSLVRTYAEGRQQ